MEKLVLAAQLYPRGRFWIGLHKVFFDNWRWSLEEEGYYGAGETTYRIWASGEPNNNGGNEGCAVMTGNGYWYDYTCSSQQQFICSSGPAATVSFIMVNQYKTWSEAQLYCREHYTDLASVRNQAENDRINKITQYKTVWIGLHREQWMWVDGTPLSFSQWNPGEPNGDRNTACVLLYEGHWDDASCDNKLYFFCTIAQMQVVSVEVTKHDPAGNMEDAAGAMLQQMSQNLKDHGLGSTVRLTWRKQPDGKIFKLVKKAEEKKPEHCSLLYLKGLCFLPACFPRIYIVVEKELTWPEAQNYCSENNATLTMVKKQEDMEKLVLAAQLYPRGRFWIGLHKVFFDNWRWSLEEEGYYGAGESAFSIWAAGEPNNYGGNEGCAVLTGNGYWSDYTCSSQQQFVCSSGPAATVSFIIVNQYKTWSEAQLYCREHYTDLASVRNQAENDRINKITQYKTVWIGLHREQWMWVDGTPLSFRQWNPEEPNGDGNTACVLLHEDHWDDASCDNKFYFFCTIEIIDTA
ncbi:macrophage mannose receptor 1-like [Parambassis ranga]|uniref:Macrophage mannose receptor 1-like n=1 Tax=Parambassis ranga TaxID=210632 RepID=A0A6P7IX93_9TELE|nr:macrophage mannose receptor 1-like [Parambassis ranga]